MKIVTQGSWRPACLGGGGDDTGMDVLKGVGVADGAVIGWEDVFRGEFCVVFFLFGGKKRGRGGKERLMIV